SHVRRSGDLRQWVNSASEIFIRTPCIIATANLGQCFPSYENELAGAATSASADSSAEIKNWSGCRFFVSPATIGQKNDELRLLSEQETSHREQKQKTRRKVMPQYLVSNY